MNILHKEGFSTEYTRHSVLWQSKELLIYFTQILYTYSQSILILSYETHSWGLGHSTFNNDLWDDGSSLDIIKKKTPWPERKPSPEVERIGCRSRDRIVPRLILRKAPSPFLRLFLNGRITHLFSIVSAVRRGEKVALYDGRGDAPGWRERWMQYSLEQ